MRRIKNHTVEKLEYISKYIKAYLDATSRLPNKVFIDAFAGTGKCVLCNNKSCDSSGGDLCDRCGKGQLQDGSSVVALKMAKSFDEYILVEISNQNIKDLENILRNEIPEERLKKVVFKKGDSNILLRDIAKSAAPFCGYLIFLDPEGAELEWNTLEHLSKINKADILILYAYDMSLVRLTADYKERLNKFYGSDGWQIIYDDKKLTPSDKATKLLKYYTENLKQIGFEYVVPKPIHTRLREGKRLYHLILATKNRVGEKIMKDIFDKELDGQGKLPLFKKF
ncbi:MAG: three-Cys-motif partner protein TcmP [Candidatus Magasanikbacteria bacterium]